MVAQDHTGNQDLFVWVTVAITASAVRRHEIVLLSWFVLVGLLVNIAVVNFS